MNKMKTVLYPLPIENKTNWLAVVETLQSFQILTGKTMWTILEFILGLEKLYLRSEVEKILASKFFQAAHLYVKQNCCTTIDSSMSN